MFNSLGINCGPGTFLQGVQKYSRVLTNYAEHSFGTQTCSVVSGTSSIPVSSDYATWVAPAETDCVFANAETWEEAQNAVKFIYSSKIPIGILDVRGTFFASYETILRELAELGFCHGYRTAYILYSSLSFKSGFSERRMSFVTYQKEKNFNVSAPEIPESLDTLFDSIGNSLHSKVRKIQPAEDRYDKDCSYELTYDEKLCARKIKPGHTLLGGIPIRPKIFPGTCRAFLQEIKDDPDFSDICRPGWGFRLHYSDLKKVRYLHPKHTRFLTIGELMSLNNWDRLPIGQHPVEQVLHGTPAPIGEWLGLQAKHFLQDKWKGNDWHITYSPKLKKFVGGTANPLMARKYIDISEYFNDLYLREDPRVFPSKEQFEEDFIVF